MQTYFARAANFSNYKIPERYMIAKMLVTVIFSVTLSSAHADGQYLSTNYHFRYPATWGIEISSQDVNCIFLIEQNFIKRERRELELCEYERPLEEVVSQTAFQKEGGTWIAAGSMDIQRARISSLGRGLTLLETVIPPSCGIRDKAGFHSAGGQCYSAIVSNGKFSVIVSSDGVWTNFAAMKRLVRSISFSVH